MKKMSLKLTHYSIIAGVLSAYGIQKVNAQIIYKDIDPDILLDPDGTGSLPEFLNESEQIDLNEDGINDFTVRADYDYYIPSDYSFLVKRNITQIVPKDNNAVAANEGTPDVFDPAHIFTSGDEINASYIWHDAVPFTEQAWLADIDLANDNIFCDDWLNKKYKYAGLRIKEGTNYKYGWIRLSVDEISDAVTIHDYAINNTENTPIIAGDAGSCFPPSVSGTGIITSSSAKVQWAPVLGALNYGIRYKKTGSSAWTNKNASGTAVFKNLNGLDCGETYQWQIKVKCADGSVSSFSAIHTFSTPTCRIGNDEENNGNNTVEIAVYPNPANKYITIDGVQNYTGLIQILNMEGKAVAEKLIAGDISTQIYVEELNAGIYIMKLKSDAGEINRKIIISR